MEWRRRRKKEKGNNNNNNNSAVQLHNLDHSIPKSTIVFSERNIDESPQ